MRCSAITTRLISCVLALCLVLASVGDAEAAKKKSKRYGKRAVITRVLGVNDPRYSAIIMNPATGEIYHSQSSDARRYPASLTKVMTLYLLFEALDQGSINLDDRMEVSEYAARMPQTNLALDAGDRIDVETAIQALVVRSANDVAVVVAEHLAGSTENFAKRMTTKARALGMKNTVFKNPNGLPNAEQYTTARDMAKLGIAIKRDFPKYYPYFSTLQFSHNGVTYYTHNRVLLRYAGADGIKTGYIGLSGFNLISSAVRGGRPVVGVVMGGGTGKWRDNRMIELLDGAYRTIASRGAARGKTYPGNLPLPRPGTKEAGIAESPDAAVTPFAALDETTVPESSDDENEAEVIEEPEVKVTYEEPQKAPVVAAAKPTRSKVIKVSSAPIEEAPVAQEKPAPETFTISPPSPTEKVVRPENHDHQWGIQVGAFSSQTLADAAIRNAQAVAARQLIGSQPAGSAPAAGGANVYRARLEGISQSQARRACEVLISNNSPCFTYKMK